LLGEAVIFHFQTLAKTRVWRDYFMIPFGGDLANKILLLAWASSDFSFPNIYEN
jgi:hypothetical protein